MSFPKKKEQKKKKKMPKIQKFKFRNSFNKFGRDPPQGYTWIWGANQVHTSEEMSFETLTPIWSHINENEKKIGKNPNFEISQFFEQL